MTRSAQVKRSEGLWLRGIRYDEALRFQAQCAAELARTEQPVARFFAFEPAPVITCGKQISGQATTRHVYVAPSLLEAQGIELCFIDRGGGATYHGPGTVVGFPVLNLAAWFGSARSVRAYIHVLEQTMIRTLANYGVKAGLREGHPGVWTARGKIGFVGIRIRDGMPSHGFSLNVSCDTRVFRYFLPCNIQDCQVTSLREEGMEIAVPQVFSDLHIQFDEVMATHHV